MLECVHIGHTAQQLAWHPVQVGSQANPLWAGAATVAALHKAPASVIAPGYVSWRAGPLALIPCAAAAHCSGSRANRQQASQMRMGSF